MGTYKRARLEMAASIIAGEYCDLMLGISDCAKVLGLSRYQLTRRVSIARAAYLSHGKWPGDSVPQPERGTIVAEQTGRSRWRYSDVLRWLATRPVRRVV